MNYIEIAKKWSKNGFSVIPVNSEKNPAIPTWTEYQTRPMTQEECEKHFSDCWGIALVMGTEKMLTAIDIDLKNVIVCDFFENYKKSIPRKIIDKFYVQSTKNKGMHFVFTSDVLENNQKLACRETTPEEKHEVYLDNFKSLRTRGMALRIATNHKSVVTIETRGNGGYIVIAPSPGYTAVCGKIDHLTKEEYESLMEISRSFNEYMELHRDFKMERYRNSDVNPFEEFNERGDVLDVLYQNGWELVAENKNNVRLKRPGNPLSKSSALYDKKTRVFNVFSTSNNLEANRGYAPASLFTLLMANGDLDEARKLLLQKGFGEKLS